MTIINIFSENTNTNIDIDEKKYLTLAKKIFKFYMKQDFFKDSSVFGFDYKTVSFDILYCNNEKTHEINREYRHKDYVADIITFSIFADSDEKFIFDNEINLGEFIISLDKVLEKSDGSKKSFEYELSFLIAHGIMHLLGFDHQTQEDYNFVVEQQNKALESLGIIKDE